MAGDDFDIPGEWYSIESFLFNDLIGGDYEAFTDEHLQGLFDTAMFDPDTSTEERQEAYDALIEYLWEEYNINFEDAFDWEDYREWYDSQ